MSAAGALRRLPSLLMAQQSHRASAGLQAAAASQLMFTGASEQQSTSRSTSHGVLGAAAAILGVGAVATASGNLNLSSADAPTRIEVVADPYARPSEAHSLPTRITLYQYEVCPYCCKVRALLDYFKLPYTCIEVNPLTKGELKWSTYKKVPVMKLDDEIVADSSAIMSRLATDVAAARAAAANAAKQPPPSAAPAPAAATAKRSSWSFFGGSGNSNNSTNASSAKDRVPAAAAEPKEGVATPGPEVVDLEEEVRWRKWVDERLVKVLTANIYRNWDESVETFKYITEQTGWGWGTREIARWTGAVMMWQVGKRMPAKYGIEGDLRTALYDTANDFVDNALRGRRFAGGDEPNLADISAFGVIRAVRKTGAFRDLMANSRLEPWFVAMEEAVGGSARLDEPAAAGAA